MTNVTRAKVILVAAIFFLAGALLIEVVLQSDIYSTVAKPVIYLYPETSSTVSVSVTPDGWFTVTDPQIKGNTWEVLAEPSGQLVVDSVEYPYLFYESTTPQDLRRFEGWVVEDSDVVDWFNEYLPKMGLNDAETKDFVDYWSLNLPDSPYYRIMQISQDDYDSIARLEINPQPDTIIRVILSIETLDEAVDIPEPIISTPDREGFTVVEWGASLI